MTAADSVALAKARRTAPEARAWIAGALALLVLAPASILFLDKPISSLAFANLHGVRPYFDALTHIVDPFHAGASLILIWTLIRIARGDVLSSIEDVLLRMAISVAAAVMVKDQLKWAFGRTWPETWVQNNPSFIKDGVYGFFPFHGGQGWYSFPSGHTTVICAATAVLWLRWPKGRPLYALLAGLVVLGLLGADYHWLSDVMAGAALGVAVGVVSARFGLPAPRAAES